MIEYTTVWVLMTPRDLEMEQATGADIPRLGAETLCEKHPGAKLLPGPPYRYQGVRVRWCLRDLSLSGPDRAPVIGRHLQVAPLDVMIPIILTTRYVACLETGLLHNLPWPREQEEAWPLAYTQDPSSRSNRSGDLTGD